MKVLILSAIQDDWKMIHPQHKQWSWFDDPDVHEPLDDECIPHKNWLSVISYLKNLGYQESQHYKICCSNDHVKLLEYATQCPERDRNWCKYLDYFVLGIQLEDIFLDRVTIEHLAQGFKGKPDGINCKETWHDQTATLLPTSSPNCVGVLKRLLILEALWEITSNFAVGTVCCFYIHQSSWSGIPLPNHTTFMKMDLMHLWKSREWLPFNWVVREHTKMKGQIMKLWSLTQLY